MRDPLSSAHAPAVLRLPQPTPAVSMTTFRWAILGTGVVSRNFLLGLRSSAFDARVTAVASRTRANAERFARAFRVPHASDSFEAACASPEVDAVYVATPPAAHETHALLAISAGKPVLLEKPFAMNAASARRITGAGGELRAFAGSFSAAVRPDAGTGILRAASGGGALTYRGVYPLSLACLVMGPVTEAHAVATFGETGVGEDTIVACRHANGVSTIQAGFRTDATNDFRIMGAAGVIHVESPIPSVPAALQAGGARRSAGTAQSSQEIAVWRKDWRGGPGGPSAWCADEASERRPGVSQATATTTRPTN